MPEPLRRISLELLSDGRLVIFHGRGRAIFRQPIEAAIFIQLLVNQLQIQAGVCQHEHAERHRTITPDDAKGAAQAGDHAR